MFQLSENAKEKIRLILKEKDSKDWGVKVLYEGGVYIDFIQKNLGEVSPQEKIHKIKKKKLFLETDDFSLVIDPVTEQQLEEASVDYIDGGILRGAFEVTLKKDMPVELSGTGPDPNNPQVGKIQALLKDEINPAIAMHGGYAELLDVKDNTVYLRLGGGCQGCGMADVTLRQGIELRIKEEVPEIIGVVDQTNHAGGTNPYFQPSK